MNPAPLRLRALSYPDDSDSPDSDVPPRRDTAGPKPATTSVAQLRRFRELDEERPELDFDSADDLHEWAPRDAAHAWSLGRVGGVALLVVVLVCAGFALAQLLRSEPQAVTAPQLPGIDDVAAPQPQEDPETGEKGPAAAPDPDADVVVSVVGLVHRPGLVTLGAGARVADAIAAAGGSRDDADMTSLNLARPVADGEQVVVGAVPPEGPPAPGSSILAAGGDQESDHAGETPQSGDPASPGGEGKVDLNTASAAELESLNGVGPATAAAIIDYRESSGPFSTVEQLGEVKGIGPAKLESLREQVVV